MYEVKTYGSPADNFLAGDAKVEKEWLYVKSGEEIKARSLVKLSEGKLAAYTADDASAGTVPYGIAAADAENDMAVVYLTGDFFSEKLILPEGMTAEAVKPLLRSNGIFLKELLNFQESIDETQESIDETQDAGAGEGEDSGDGPNLDDI